MLQNDDIFKEAAIHLGLDIAKGQGKDTVRCLMYWLHNRAELKYSVYVGIFCVFSV